MLEPLPNAGEPIADYRARIARRRAEVAEERQRELVEQASIINSPDLRIRIWERLHEIALPRDTGHRLLGVIAAQTGLTMNQVQEEQRNRAQPLPGNDPAASAPEATPSVATIAPERDPNAPQ